MKQKYKLLGLMAALLMVASACAGSSDTASDDTSTDDTSKGSSEAGASIEYWLWDDNQQPLYEECAKNFGEESGITVNVLQLGWDEYWNGLTSGFATGDVPDVFVNHLSQYPDMVESDVLVPLNDLVEDNDTPTDIYWPGLAELWVTPDGNRYGMPKDFDTIAIVVNQDLLEGTDLSLDDLKELDWNPQDGGSFEATIAKLTIDENGVRGDEPGFDAENVATYGFTSNNSYNDALSQSGFSMFVASNGFEYNDQVPWGTKYNYDDPAFFETIAWWRSLVEKGYMPDADVLAGSSADTLFGEGFAASMVSGSWQISTWTTGRVNGAYIPSPVGPTGQRASMFNGVSDSITQASDNRDAAWQWVQYAASADCQNIVGEGAVVFPAIPEATGKAEVAHKENGVDVEAFLVHLEDETTFLHPVTKQTPEVQQIMGNAVESVMRGDGDVETIKRASEEVNELELS